MGHITEQEPWRRNACQRFKVDFVFSGRPPEDYFDMAVFWCPIDVSSLSFVARNATVRFVCNLQELRIFFMLYRDTFVHGYERLL